MEVSMSQSGSTVLSQLQSTVTTSVTTGFPQLAASLTSDLVGLVGQQAQDFDNLVDNWIENIEAGQSPSAAWSNSFATFVAAEKTQLWDNAVAVAQQFASWLDGVTKLITSSLQAV
jgi:hypothetical protein